ncbi:MAG: thymidine kinase [Planctomycetes bacterium]|nr:thymidine kinase [Planctomycetota bacterium]
MRSPLVYCGPMWGGKTEGLISRLVRARIQKVRVAAFTPAINTRDGEACIRSHSGASFPAVPVQSGEELLEHADQADVVGIDEAFMISGIVEAVRELNDRRKKIVMATLDMDSEGKVWEPVGHLLGMAEEIVKCPAVCSVCKHDAYYTFRLPDAPSERLLVGAGDFYEPRCYPCWEEGQREKRIARGQQHLFRTGPELPG